MSFFVAAQRQCENHMAAKTWRRSEGPSQCKAGERSELACEKDR